jgi:hypothetical protein
MVTIDGVIIICGDRARRCIAIILLIQIERQQTAHIIVGTVGGREQVEVFRGQDPSRGGISIPTSTHT